MKNQIFIALLFIIFSIINVSAQTQAEMNEIAMNDYKKSDNQLNVYYKQLVKMLDEKSKQKLVETQRAWIKYRDSHCEFEANFFEGGSIVPLIKYSCLQNITEQRIEDLKQSIKVRETF